MDTRNVAPWKWGVIIGAGLLSVVVWFVVLSGGDKIKLADGSEAVDIETGQVFFLPIPPQRLFPVANPDTGRETLVPVWEDMDGTWYLQMRHVPTDSEFRDGIEIEIEWDTGRVETNGKEIRRAK